MSPSRPVLRRWYVAAVMAGAVGCDGYYFDPAPPGPTIVAATFRAVVQPNLTTAQEAFDRIDAARITISHGGAVLFQDVVVLEAVADGWAAEIQVEVDESEGPATLEAQLLDSGDPLLEGEVTITLRPGIRSEATIPLRLIDEPPVITILAPIPGTVGVEGTPLTFQGQAVDKPEGDLSASLTWNSSKEGYLGTGSTVTVNLRPVSTSSVPRSRMLLGKPETPPSRSMS